MLALAFSICCSSCEEEQKVDPQTLKGRWEIVKGLRNQKETETLAGTYFQFEDGAKMITNLPVGPEERMDFELDKQTILQKSSPPVKYEILSLSDTSLILGLELRGMQFEMHFQRGTAPANNDTLDTWPHETAPEESGTSE